MVEYSVVSVVILVGGVAGWPFLVQLMNGLSKYFASIYYVLLSPVP
ncbi:MAG: hypothetical protein ACOZIN_19995 [Myxococcota bacterium]